MSSLERLPPEILQEIVSYLHDGYERHHFGGYDPPLGQHEVAGIKRRPYLASLRAVNGLFYDFVTPILFQHAIIYSGSVTTRWGVTAVTSSGVTGTARLVKLSKNHQLREIVRRLEICLKIRGPNDFQDYKPVIEERDKDLEYIARMGSVIHSALPRFTNLTILKLNFEDIPYSYSQEFDDPDLNTCCWVQDTENFFESLATALFRSGLNNLEELDLSLPLAYDFGHFLEDDDDGGPHSPQAFFKRLKRLSVHYGHCTEEDEDLEFRYNQSNQIFDRYIRELIPLATNLNTLKVKGPDVLVLDSSSLEPLTLEVLDLQSLSITGETLIALFQRSTALREVVLMGVYLESGTWVDILTALSKTTLTEFYIETCGYQKDGETILRVPVNPTAQAKQDDSYVETNCAEDIDACDLVFARVHENMRKLHGSRYDQAAAEKKREVLHEDIIRKTGSLGEFCRRFFAEIEQEEDTDEDGDSSETESEDDGENIVDFLEMALGQRTGDVDDDQDLEDHEDGVSSDVESSDSGLPDDE
ncbi:uncharacterized protein FMAN_13206 [Fusarium mangiferae]|uniref:Uncharacterized protein n=1 Tax=Fusarium mangiferae TaxID=192010 RepID=A0A1L7TJD8_FUSMA|nr:uncharacterized protein FMAN_13206 [Fusarium mangiferae]CVK94926.1 uncharacterized protein FMAN_13206 [Fusarium mangiferae]